MIGIGIGIGRMTKNWSRYWATQSEVLFFGEISKIIDGKLYNQKSGTIDYMTVGGTTGSYTFQCPNTAPYITADTDYIWFKPDETRRIVTTAELIGYDLQRTPVKYDDNEPYAIRAIMILKVGESLTSVERDRLFRDFWLQPYWDNSENDYGHIKGNRTLYVQNLWPIYESELMTYISGLVTPLSSEEKTLMNNFLLSVKSGMNISNLLDAFDIMYFLAAETAESYVKNLVKDDHHITPILSPTFTTLAGVNGNASTQYLKTDYNPAIDKVTFTEDNACIGFYCRSTMGATSGAIECGCTDGTYTIQLAPRLTGDIYSCALNGSGGTSPTNNATTPGMFIGVRDGNVITHYRNKGVIGTKTITGSGIPNYEVYILVRNTSGTAGSFSGKQLSLFFMGRALSQDDVNVLTDAFETYMDANGKGVIS